MSYKGKQAKEGAVRGWGGGQPEGVKEQWERLREQSVTADRPRAIENCITRGGETSLHHCIRITKDSFINPAPRLSALP